MTSRKENFITKPAQGCPAGYGYVQEEKKEVKDATQEGVNVLADAGGISYGDYLQLDKILTAQVPQSRLHGQEVHDEHLFIVTHQVTMLKQVNIYDKLPSRHMSSGSSK